MKNVPICLAATLGLTVLCGHARAGQIPAPPFHKPVIMENRLFSVAEPEGDVVCVDTRKRQVVWRTTIGKAYYGLWNTRNDLIANSDDEFTILSIKKGRVVRTGKLPGLLMGVGEGGAVFVTRGDDHSLTGFSPEERRTIWTVPKVRVDPVAVGKHFLFCISQHDVTVRMDQTPIHAEVVDGEYSLLCIDLKTGTPVWKKPLDYALHGDVGHAIPFRETSEHFLCTVGNSVWLVKGQDGSLLATQSFLPEHNEECRSSSVRDTLFWGNSNAVVIVGQPRFPPDLGTNSYTVYILDLPKFTIQKRLPTPPLLYESIVIGDVLYSGPTAIHLPEARITSSGQDHRSTVRGISGWTVPSVDGWLYVSGCRGDSAKYGTSRILARLRLGTNEFEELVEEPSAFSTKKDSTEPKPDGDGLKPAP